MKKRIKICHVVTRMDIGGMENGIINLLNRHDRRSFEPLLCCLNGGGPMIARLQDDIEVIQLKLKEGATQLLYGPFQARRIFKNKGIDIIHTHGWGGGSWIGVTGGKLAKVPVIINGEHGSFYEKKHQIIMQKMIAKMCNSTFSVSESLKKQIIDKLDTAANRILVIPNGVDTEIFKPKTRQALPNGMGHHIKCDDFVIACIGTLRPEKNQTQLINAVENIVFDRNAPNIKLLIIGDGPDREKLKRLVQSKGLEKHIFFMGSRNDIAEILGSVQLLVSVSLPYWEGLSNVMLEAMSAGIPIIATESIGAAEIIIEGRNGFLIKANDPKELHDRILWMACNHDLRTNMGLNAREFVCEKFSIAKMVSSYEQAYRNLMIRNIV